MRRYLPALLIALVLTPAAAAPAGARTPAVVGISDQSPSTFTNPFFVPLKVTTARYVAPWDVMSHDDERWALQQWIAAATAAHQRILIAFEGSHIRGHQRKLPSVNAYASGIRRFHAAYPRVRDIQPWNEVNRCQRKLADGYYVGQATCHRPQMAALYYLAAKRIFRGAKVTGLDILDQSSVGSAVRYVKAFLRYVHPRPRYWGLHNYADTNRFSDKRTRALLKATHKGDVWLTETGGIVSSGSAFPFSTARAARALGCTFAIARESGRIKRVYVYDFNGTAKRNRFDAGLLNPDNTLRPGYAIVQQRKPRRCRR